jgi:alpha-N-arabinofuranosidase
MDGPWQLGHGTATEYAQLAAKTARAMRQVDTDLELVVCGSSGAAMPTFGEWERIVLEETYDDVDFISCHAYYEPRNGDLASFLASAVDMDRFIESVVATADHVKARRHSDKTINLSFDEWNVWYQSRYNDVEKITDANEWPHAPRLLEDSYSVMDAVVFGNLLISLLRHADRVTAASLAQLVNVIAPIMTEPDGPAWRQTTFHPFAITSRLARGTALAVKLDSPTVHTDAYGEVPMVDAVATHDDVSGATSVFLVNRSLTETVTVHIDAVRLGVERIESADTLHDEDLHAANTMTHPDRVVPQPNPTARVDDGTVSLALPPVSWTALALH